MLRVSRGFKGQGVCWGTVLPGTAGCVQALALRAARDLNTL